MRTNHQAAVEPDLYTETVEIPRHRGALWDIKSAVVGALIGATASWVLALSLWAMIR